jgi:hypothetical protein
MRRTLLRRTLPATAASLSLLMALTACGEDAADDPGGQESSEAPAGPASLTAAQAEAAVLAAPDLGAGWVEQPQTSDDDEPIPGCIGEIDALGEIGERSVEIKRVHSFESGLPQVSSGVAVWSDEDDLVEVFDRIETTIDECETVEYTEDNGATFRITLEPQTDIAVDGVDDQNGFTATGTITEADGEDYPVHFHMVRFRVGTNVATLSTTGSEDESAIHDQYARLAAERLVTAVAGAPAS